MKRIVQITSVFLFVVCPILIFALNQAAALSLPAACNIDADKSGTIDLSDLSIFSSNYKRSGINCAYDIAGGNCYLDIADFSQFASAYNKLNYCKSAQVSPTDSMWITQAELDALPVSGAAWTSLTSYAQNTVTPDFTDQNSKGDVYTMAKALVYAKTKDPARRTEVVNILKDLVNTHPVTSSSSWDWLGILRGLGGYVIAADLIKLGEADSAFDQNVFRPWLTKVRLAVVEGGRGSVISAQEARPNNFGTHASASRIAVALYLKDTSDLQRAIAVFKGYLGDRSAYSEDSNPGFNYGELTWQCDKNNPVGVNPKGCVVDGKNLGGVLPEEARRCSATTLVWPPCKSDYMWEGMQGTVVASELLHRAGYDAYNWSDQSVLRSVKWLYNTTFSDGKNFPATGDDVWQIYIINKRYGTSFVPSGTGSPGKMVGFADWTHR